MKSVTDVESDSCRLQQKNINITAASEFSRENSQAPHPQI